MIFILEKYTNHVRLISLAVYDLERRQLPESNITDSMPTGIACPLCNYEIYANADIKMKRNRIAAWCTNYVCPWRGELKVYKAHA